MAYAQDLKSCDRQFGRAGSSPARTTRYMRVHTLNFHQKIYSVRVSPAAHLKQGFTLKNPIRDFLVFESRPDHRSSIN